MKAVKAFAKSHPKLVGALGAAVVAAAAYYGVSPEVSSQILSVLAPILLGG